jgi:hypothetical protein
MQRYTEDVIYGIKWRWTWNKGQLVDLSPHCRHCDAACITKDTQPGMTAPTPSVYFDCPQHPLHLCPWPWIGGTEREVRDRMVAHITQNAQTGTRGPASPGKS